MAANWELPPSGCELKLNDCVSAGIGPGCCSDTTETSGCSDAKRQCEDQVKKSCEEKIEQCKKDCRESIVKPYERLVKAEKEKQEREKKEYQERVQKCEKEVQSGPRYQSYMEAYRRTVIDTGLAQDMCAARGHRRRTPTGGDPPFLTWECCPDNPGSVIQNLQRQPTRVVFYPGWNDFRFQQPADYGEVPYMEKEFGQNVCGEYKQKAMQLEYFQFQQTGIEDCRKIKAPENKFNPNCPCDECRIKEVNERLARCFGGCYERASHSGCKTSHCSCGSFKCPGPPVRFFGAGGGIKQAQQTQDGNQTGKTKGDKEFRTRDVTFNLTFSVWGTPLELIYTRAFLPGNLLWINDVTEEREVRTVAQFDDATQTFVPVRKLVIDNFISFHLGLCAGEVDDISRIWLDGQIVYDRTINATVPFSDQQRMTLVLQRGSEAQKVRKKQAVREGFGRVPAYRGIAGVHVDDINLSVFRKFPDFKIEVVKSLDTSDMYDSTAVSGGQDIIKFDPDARRLYVKTGTGVSVRDYDGFALVQNVTVSNVRHVTRLPAILSYTAPNYTLYDVTFEDARATLASDITVGTTFMYRHVNSNNYGRETLVAASSTGEMRFYTVDDFRDPLTLQPSIELYQAFGGMFSGTVQAFAHLHYTRPERLSSLTHVWDSLFAFRSDGTDIEVHEFVNNSTDNEVNNDSLLLEDGASIVNTITAPFEGETDGVVVGAVPTEFGNGGVLLFVSFDTDTQFKIIFWHPYTGIVWEKLVAALPENFTMRQNSARYIFFFDTAGDVKRLDLSDGTLSTVNVGTVPALGGNQYFDSENGNIYYWTGTEAAVVYANRVVAAPNSVAEAITDISTRAGLTAANIDVTAIADIDLVGFRSGPDTVARPIIEQLLDAYGLTVFEDEKIIFLKKGTNNNVDVSEQDLENPFAYERVFENYETRSSRVDYYSNDTNGEPASQFFSLPDDPYNARVGLIRSFTLLENDEYMRSLAELLVFKDQEDDAESKIRLAWKYLTLTPTDMATINQAFRVNKLDIGADLSLSLELSLDAPSKYANLVPITGTEGFGRVERAADIGPLPAPLAFVHRAMGAGEKYSADVFFGVSNVVGEFADSAVVSLSSHEYESAIPGGALKEVDGPVIWGHLVTAPPATTSPFTTQQGAELQIRFTEQTDLTTLFVNGLLPETFYYTQTLNVIVVGNEIIQFQEYEVDIVDPTLVTFRHLMRARFSTEMFMAHTVGEVCYFVDYDRTQQERTVDETNDLPIKTKTNRERQVRRYDVSIPADILRPLPPHGTTRWDWTAASGFDSTLYPDNPHIFIETGYRYQNARDLSLVVEETAFNQADYFVFLLRDTFDLGTFEANLLAYPGNTSYIIYAAKAQLHDFRDNAFLNPVDHLYYGVLWLAQDHDVADWEAATEPLTAVVMARRCGPDINGVLRCNYDDLPNHIPSNLLSASLSYSTWYPGEYKSRRQRSTITGFETVTL